MTPAMKRTFLTARFDVTALTIEERGRLAILVGVQHEGGIEEGYPDIAYPSIEIKEKETDMELMICIDGAEFATVPLIDGNDPFNAEAERGALDRAYEAKSTNPDSVVTIVIVAEEEEEELIDFRLAASEVEYIADMLALFAGVDEGENIDADRVFALSKELRDLLPVETS